MLSLSKHYLSHQDVLVGVMRIRYDTQRIEVLGKKQEPTYHQTLIWERHDEKHGAGTGSLLHEIDFSVASCLSGLFERQAELNSTGIQALSDDCWR